MYLLLIGTEVVDTGRAAEELLVQPNREAAIELWYRAWALMNSGQNVLTGKGGKLKRILRAQLFSVEAADRKQALAAWRAGTAERLRDSDNISAGLSDSDLAFLKDLVPAGNERT